MAREIEAKSFGLILSLLLGDFKFLNGGACVSINNGTDMSRARFQ